jgi:predicted AlkP superfamily phosphohydrolase/phosphomutase
VNLAGREPAGKVAPGEFDAVCESIERELLAFTNADTGAPVVQRVWRIDEVFRGPNLHHLPDLIVEWNRDAPIARVHSPKTGEISGTYTKPRTGDHSPDGFFCMTGSGARSGRIGRNVSIMDFGPTIAERLGVELADVDGHSFAGAVFPDRASSAHA